MSDVVLGDIKRVAVTVLLCRSCGDPVSSFDKACPSCGVIDPVLPPSTKDVVVRNLVTALVAAAVAGIFYVGYC